MNDKPGTIESDLKELTRSELISLENAITREWARRNNPHKHREIRLRMDRKNNERSL